MIAVTQVEVEIGGIRLLDPVSTAVAAGQALVVRGPNGAGKTTLLRVLAGAQRPTGGQVRIAGRPVDSRDRGFRGRVAAMIGMPPLATDLTVREHVLMVATSWPGAAADLRADAMLDDLRLGALRDRFPHELSSGQTQLLGLAMTAARPADVLILDEPEQRLDPDHLQVVADLLSRRRDDGVCLVVATHSERLTGRLADLTIDVAPAA